MEASVTIPTLGQDLTSLQFVLGDLSRQTFRDFNLKLILPRSSRMLTEQVDVLLESTSLDAEICFQPGTGFEDAMSTALSISDDINVNTDDDSRLTEDFLASHFGILKESDVGILSGAVNGTLPFLDRSGLLYATNSIGSRNCLDPGVCGGAVLHFNEGGLLSFGNSAFARVGRKLFSSLGQIGVNLSWKRTYTSGFSFPRLSARGILNESILAFHIQSQGGRACLTRQINVSHKKHASLSRDRSDAAMVEKFTDVLTSTLYLHRRGFSTEKGFARCVKLLGLFASATRYSEPVRDSIRLVQTALIEDWADDRFRDEYIQLRQGWGRVGDSFQVYE